MVAINLSILGTVSATSSGKYIMPLSSSTLKRLLGLAIAVDMNPKMNAPNPNPPKISPVAIPLRNGKCSQAQNIGVQ